MKPLFQRILVPVDFSPSGTGAFRLACGLAREEGVSLMLLHVYPVPGVYFPGGFVQASPETFRKLVEETEDALEKLKRDALANGAREVSVDATEGAAETEIVNEATSGRYDLIVMGTHGRTGVRHALMGSVAEGVLRHAPCPVLIIRGQQD